MTQNENTDSVDHGRELDQGEELIQPLWNNCGRLSRIFLRGAKHPRLSQNTFGFEPRLSSERVYNISIESTKTKILRG